MPRDGGERTAPCTRRNETAVSAVTRRSNRDFSGNALALAIGGDHVIIR
jgi:hypothetical protein